MLDVRNCEPTYNKNHTHRDLRNRISFTFRQITADLRQHFKKIVVIHSFL